MIRQRQRQRQRPVLKDARPADDISIAGGNADRETGKVGELLRSAHLQMIISIWMMIIILMMMIRI